MFHTFSNLEENNLALALHIIEQEIVKKHGIKINFGRKKEKAFESFENFRIQGRVRANTGENFSRLLPSEVQHKEEAVCDLQETGGVR